MKYNVVVGLVEPRTTKNEEKYEKMNTILISYDLQAPGKDYARLWEHLKSYGNRAKPLESVWLIRTIYNAEQVRNSALNYIDKNDKIFVVDVTSRAAAWENIDAEVVRWIGSIL